VAFFFFLCTTKPLIKYKEIFEYITGLKEIFMRLEFGEYSEMKNENLNNAALSQVPKEI
jgi:hypothetical protein